MKANQKGFSLIELLLVVTIAGILASLAVPSLLAARRAANEGSAIASLRAIFNAEMIHHSTAGLGNFSASLTELEETGLIDPVLATGIKSGYSFYGSKTDKTMLKPASVFYSAIPSTPTGQAQTGTRRFAIATDGVLRVTDEGLVSHFTGLNDVLTTRALSY